jgi:hypothetical protein
MSNANARMSDADLTDLMVKLASRPEPPDHTRASVVDIASHRRQPLGLRPVIEPEDEPSRAASPYDDDSGEPYGGYMHGPIVDTRDNKQSLLDSTPDFRFVYFCLNVAGGLVDTVHQRTKEENAEMKAKLAELQLERERDRATIAEMRAKLGELDFVVERLKVENRGPPGVAGPRAATALTASEDLAARRANAGRKVRG